MSTAAERINWRLRAMLEETEAALEGHEIRPLEAITLFEDQYLQGKRDALKYALDITIQEIHE